MALDEQARAICPRPTCNLLVSPKNMESLACAIAIADQSHTRWEGDGKP